MLLSLLHAGVQHSCQDTIGAVVACGCAQQLPLGIDLVVGGNGKVKFVLDFLILQMEFADVKSPTVIPPTRTDNFVVPNGPVPTAFVVVVEPLDPLGLVVEEGELAN